MSVSSSVNGKAETGSRRAEAATAPVASTMSFQVEVFTRPKSPRSMQPERPQANARASAGAHRALARAAGLVALGARCRRAELAWLRMCPIITDPGEEEHGAAFL